MWDGRELLKSPEENWGEMAQRRAQFLCLAGRCVGKGGQRQALKMA